MHEYNATVPDPNDPLVQFFLEKYQLGGTPLRIEYLDRGYDLSQCHLSAKHCAIANDGRRVHGCSVQARMKKIPAKLKVEHQEPGFVALKGKRV